MNEETTATDAPMRLDWPWRTWLVHLLFFGLFLLYAVSAFSGQADFGSLWFVVGCSVLWFLAGAVNGALLRGLGRSFVGMLLVLVNPFLIPLSMHVATEGNNELAVACSLVYVLMVILVSPWRIGLAAALSGTCFAVVQRLFLRVEGGEVSAGMVTEVTVAYISLVVLGSLSRLLLAKLYRLAVGGTGAGESAEPGDASDGGQKLADLVNERDLLREALASHILEMNKMMGQPSEAKGEANAGD